MAQSNRVNVTTKQEEHVLPEGTVLIAGGGPVGLILARVLSYYGVKSVLFERNQTTTSWPKMDLTNGRSMELFRKLGLADDLRRQGVLPCIDQPVLVSSGLSSKEAITKWDLPGVEKFRQSIQENNNGTLPLEPYQRLSQAVFEKWLKAICDEDPLIDLYYSWKVESVSEEEDHVKTIVTNIDTGKSLVYISDYVAGCDGASSRVRKSLGLPLDGGPVPTCVLLVHFKSRDLTRLHKQGQFWHIFLLAEHGGFGGAIIAQDEIDTWTTHLFLPLDAQPEKIESHEAVYRVLGGLHGKYPIEIDQILVRSVWRPNIAVARNWSTPSLRVHIAGDAAHQNIPTGGYGMNMGIADAFDLGWKLGAIMKGYAGSDLLRSYESERRPVALRNVERSGVHFEVHNQLREFLAGGDPHRVDGDTEEARKLRAAIHEHYQKHDGENKDFGIEMGYRYESTVIIRDTDAEEPIWIPAQYTPTTWPGGRPPHVFLSDGTPIFDKFGKDWTLLIFSDGNCGEEFVGKAAISLSIPVELVSLSGEELAKTLYEKALVLIRPDQHVAWRADKVNNMQEAQKMLNLVTGRAETDLKVKKKAAPAYAPKAAFTATKEMTTQIEDFKLEKMGAFQM